MVGRIRDPTNSGRERWLSPRARQGLDVDSEIEADIGCLLPSSRAALDPLCGGIDADIVWPVLQGPFVSGLVDYVVDLRGRNSTDYCMHGDDSFFASYDAWWQPPADQVLDPGRSGALRVHDRAMIVDPVKVR